MPALRYTPKTPIHTFLYAAAVLVCMQLVDWSRNLAVVNCIDHWKALTLSTLQMGITLVIVVA